MKTLIVEDDFTCRKLIQAYLKDFGHCDVAVNGIEAIEAFKQAIKEKEPYDLITLDIMMPELDGMGTLEQVRKIEADLGIHGLEGVKVIMTTAKEKSTDIFGAFKKGCEAYIIKPVKADALYTEIEKLGLMKKTETK